jgi:hypothetical protein
MKWVSSLIDCLLKGTKLMENFDTLNAKADANEAILQGIDLKLDDVRAYIATIPVGSVMTQEQIDTIGAKLDAVNAHAQADLDEATGLIPPQP